MESGNRNKVSQKNNKVKKGDIVARDKITYNREVTVNNYNIIGTYQDAINYAQKNEGFVLHDISKSALFQEAISDFKDVYEQFLRSDITMLNNNTLEVISKAAAIQIKKGKFGNAHKLFEDAFEDTSNSYRDFVFKQYLITGFIHYSQENNMNGLRDLLTKRKSVIILEDSEIDLITANIFQEICSREIDIKDLDEQMFLLHDLYVKASIETKPLMANSLGLAYRRLGERAGIELLQKAISMFDEGLEYNSDNPVTEVELKDQKAITHIRIFEFNKNIVELIEAKTLLDEAIELFPSIKDSRDSRLKPRVLNNLGNVYKQMALCLELHKEKNAQHAIDCYVKAEKFWNEPNAKYEWALLQKNKGEAKYALAKVNLDTNILIDALQDCSLSTKYRTLENSPYQWGKSVDVVFQIVLFLEELKSLALISEQMQKTIKSYAKEIDKNNSKWSEMKLANLLSHAKQVCILLRNESS